jgi:glycosyltransferase involved in cell wall biosynthesis
MTDTWVEAPVRQASGRIRVLLTTEGTYPHYTGGVSTWCDRLIRGMDDVDFVVWSLMMNPFIKQQFRFPSNVAAFVEVPLWGIEQPAEYTREIPAARVFRASRNTKESDIQTHFVPLFERFLDQMSAALFSPDAFGRVLAEMHVYFRHFEYRTTWRSRAVWETFKRRLATGYELPAADADVVAEEPPLPSLASMKNSLRYLVSGGRHREPEQPAGEDVPLVAEAIEGLRWLYRLLQALNVDVPVADVTHSAAAAFCAIPCILSKIEHGTPFLLTEHGVYLREQYLNIGRRRYPYNLKRFLVDFVSAISQTAYHLADQVSPVCKFNGRWETAYGTPEERIRVIYNGVDPQVYAPVAVRRPDAPVVVQVGRIDPLKDQLTFLRVADAVRREIPNVQFHHYGPVADDEYAAEVRALHRELGLGSTVQFKGHTDRVAEAYGSADVSLMTSISEAFPFGVVEALMCGKPVVSTSVGGVSEALDGTGATAPARDVAGLANAVIHLLRLPASEREAMSVQARQRALAHYTLDQFIGFYRASYEELVGRGTTVHPAAIPAVDEPIGVPLVHHSVEETADPPPVAAEIVTGGEISVQELSGALGDPDPFVRTGAIARVRPGLEAVTPLIGALQDAYPQVRREAVRMLARIGGADAALALGDVALSDPSADVRSEAVVALGRFVATDVAEDEGAGA